VTQRVDSRRWFQATPAVAALALAAAVAASCSSAGTDDAADETPASAGSGTVDRAVVERVLDNAMTEVQLVADSVDALFRPVPLLTPAQEAAFRRFGNAQQLQRARALGYRPAGAAQAQAAVEDGRFVVLEDSTEWWVLRELTHSEPLVTPDARALLQRIGQQFHERLDGLGMPRYRLEVTSVLRTAENQAELRRTNPNAAAGESTHEYGTTLDVAYASFAAPADLRLDLDTSGADWLRPRLEWMAASHLEAVAARNNLELRAILGTVMAELQAAGDVMVTIEVLQPVYHFTVARRFGD
jgi:hypothetical protein